MNCSGTRLEGATEISISLDATGTSFERSSRLLMGEAASVHADDEGGVGGVPIIPDLVIASVMRLKTPL